MSASLFRGRGQPSRARGFALVSVVMLLTLLLLVGLGLLTLSSVSLRGGDAAKAQAEAMANARLALMLAIGDLQKHAGPDLRSTARADISETITGAPSVAQQLQPWLTGVWRTEDNPQSVSFGRDLRLKRPQKFPAYLISGNERFDATKFAASGAYPSGYLTPELPLPSGQGNRPGSVEVGHTSQSGTQQSVRAPLIALPSTGTATGGYAYWVEDEGVKARMDLTNPFEQATASNEKKAGDLLGQRNRADWIAKGATGNVPGRSLETLPSEGNHPALSKMLSLNTVAFAGSDPVAIRDDMKRLTSDLTVNSRSLLIDMQRGGFRRDLTTAFQEPNLQTMVNQGVFDSTLVFPQQLEPPSGGQAPPDETGTALYMRPGGSPWSVLKDYTQYASRITSKSQVQDTRIWTSSNGRELTAFSQFCPVVNRIQVFLDVSYEEAGLDTYQVMFHMFPMVVLWNPYDQPMRVPAFNVVLLANRNNSAGFMELAFNYNLQGNYTYVGTAPSSPSVSFGALNFSSGQPIEIPAGKSVILTTPKRHIPYSGGTQELVSEWQDGFGISLGGAKIKFDPNTPPSILVTRRALTSNNFGGNSRINSDKLGFHCENIDWDLDDSADDVGAFLPQIRPPAAPLIGPTTPRWGAIMSRKLIENQLQPLADAAAASNPTNVYPARSFAAYNLRAHHYTYVGNAAKTPPQFISSTLIAGSNVANYVKPQIANSGSASGPHYTYNGGSDLRGADSCVMFHVPRENEPVLSLAQFSHATLVRPFDGWNHRGNNFTEDLEPTYPIGNSIRPAHHPDNQLRLCTSLSSDWNTAGQAPNIRNTYRADTSFLYNNALWDTYYLSGYNTAQKNFLNPRLHWSTEDAVARAAITNPKTGLSSLYLDGGFNVNSTSKAAWKALLASTVGIRSGASGSPSDKPGYHRISDTDSQFQTLSSGTTAVSPESYQNQARMLDEDSLDRLAGQIVEQVKLRGPFPTLAAFVNRTIDLTSLARTGLTSDQVCNSGPLQAAIDGTAAANDVNKQMSRSNWVQRSQMSTTVNLYKPGVIGRVYPEAAEGARGFGAPFYLMPSDLLSKIGPYLTVRSDTFRVSAYGESRDSAGRVRARVKCEAIVQRDPSWIGNRLPVANQPTAGTVEERFGRQFRVVSFRWLNQEES